MLRPRTLNLNAGMEGIFGRIIRFKKIIPTKIICYLMKFINFYQVPQSFNKLHSYCDYLIKSSLKH